MTPARKEPDQSMYTGRFAVRLRTLREKAGLTQEQVAEAIGVAANTYFGYESGKSIPHLEKFPALAKALKLRTPQKLLPES